MCVCVCGGGGRREGDEPGVEERGNGRKDLLTPARGLPGTEKEK